MATEEIAYALRKAIESGNFEASSALAPQYREAVARELRATCSEGERAAIARETIAYLEARLHLARVLRAHVASRMANAFHAQCYRGEAACDSLWQLEA